MARKKPVEKTIKRLFSRSGNHCAFSDCDQIIATDEGYLVGEICHIEAASKGGERYNPEQSDEERASFENLIILCSVHHTITNDTVKYTVDVLRKIKADHEAKFSKKSYEVPQNILVKAIAQYKAAISRVENNTEEILEILKSGRISVQPRQEDLLPNIAEILKKAEADNNGVKFSVSHLDSDGNVTIKLIPTPEADNLNIGKVIFPNTQAGNFGRIKLISAMEKGESVYLEADEYVWESSITFPVIGKPPLQSGGLHISREIPNITIPVRLEIAPEGQPPVTVNMTYMTIIRFGTKELELQLKGGQLVGEIKLVSNLQKEKTVFTYEGVSPSTVNAVQLKKNYLMHSAFLYESKFKIIALDNEKVILEDFSNDIKSSLTKDYFDIAIRFLDILIKINQEIGIDLRFPKVINDDLFKVALYLDNVFTNGMIEIGGGETTYIYEKSEAIELLDSIIYSIKNGMSPILQIPNPKTIFFLEQEILFSDAILILVNVSLVKSIHEFEQEINLLSDGEEIDVLLKYEQAIRCFPKWVPDQNDKYAAKVVQ